MSKRVYIAGHKGMVGSALKRQLGNDASAELITRSRGELDLINQQEVKSFFKNEKIDEVYLAAAKVGGIHANDHFPADFIYQNLMMQCNVVQAAYENGITQLLMLGSSCIYPKLAKQPMGENELLAGKLEPTNEPYALAKIAGVKLCESYNRQYGVDYRSVMPTNLYGQNDNFHQENSHVVPAMLQRFHLAKINNEKEVEVWGSGRPRREFLHVNDMASACVHVMNLPKEKYQAATQSRLSHINVGVGSDYSIAELAGIMAEVVGYKGSIVFNTLKPDGAPRKLLDVSCLNDLGWQASVSLKDGLDQTYQWYLANISDLRVS